MGKKNKKSKPTSNDNDGFTLKKCPFCGSRYVVHTMYRQNPFSDYDGSCVAISCATCGVRAMYTDLDCSNEALREAIRRWNTRDGE